MLASGNLGPRVVSLNQDGSVVMVGWIMLNHGAITNFVPQSSNQFSVGTSLFDDSRGLIYAQIPAIDGEPPVLQILAEDNLTVIQKLKLPENTRGKSIFNPQSSVMYSISDSGVLVLPVGYLDSMSRVTTSAPSLFCPRKFLRQQHHFANLHGDGSGRCVQSGVQLQAGQPRESRYRPRPGSRPPRLRSRSIPRRSPASTERRRWIWDSPRADAINVIDPVRVLVNHADPNQRGTILEVPGTLVDILADPVRDRYYVLRQDNNTLLVFDGANNTLLKTLRTNNVPTTMAISFDNQYIYIGHDASQTLAIYNLDDFSRLPDVPTGAGNGNVVRSLAVANNQIIATSRDFKGQGHILLIDPVTLTATQPDAVGAVDEPDRPRIGGRRQSGRLAGHGGDAGRVYFPLRRRRGRFHGFAPGLHVAYADAYAATARHLLGRRSDCSMDRWFLSWVWTPRAASLQAWFSRRAAVRTGAVDSASPGFAERVDFSTGAAILPTLTRGSAAAAGSQRES